MIRDQMRRQSSTLNKVGRSNYTLFCIKNQLRNITTCTVTLMRLINVNNLFFKFNCLRNQHHYPIPKEYMTFCIRFGRLSCWEFVVANCSDSNASMMEQLSVSDITHTPANDAAAASVCRMRIAYLKGAVSIGWNIMTGRPWANRISAVFLFAFTPLTKLVYSLFHESIIINVSRFSVDYYASPIPDGQYGLVLFVMKLTKEVSGPGRTVHDQAISSDMYMVKTITYLRDKLVFC